MASRNFWWQASGGVTSGVIQGAFENLTVADNDSFHLEKLHFEAAIDGSADETQFFIQNGQLASEEIQAEIPRLTGDAGEPRDGSCERSNSSWRPS